MELVVERDGCEDAFVRLAIDGCATWGDAKEEVVAALGLADLGHNWEVLAADGRVLADGDGVQEEYGGALRVALRPSRADLARVQLHHDYPAVAAAAAAAEDAGRYWAEELKGAFRRRDVAYIVALLRAELAQGSSEALLRIAIMQGDAEVARAFIAEGVPALDGAFCVVARAAGRGYTAVCELLLTEAGADVNAADGDGWTPILHALNNRHEATCAALLAHGADPNVCDSIGETPLHCALRLKLEASAARLLSCGAAPDTRDRGGRTPLFWAAAQSLSLWRDLLEATSDVDAADTSTGWTPLCHAAATGNDALCRALLARGAAPAARAAGAAHACTPLQLAQATGRSDIVELLRGAAEGEVMVS